MVKPINAVLNTHGLVRVVGEQNRMCVVKHAESGAEFIAYARAGNARSSTLDVALCANVDQYKRPSVHAGMHYGSRFCFIQQLDSIDKLRLAYDRIRADANLQRMDLALRATYPSYRIAVNKESMLRAVERDCHTCFETPLQLKTTKTRSGKRCREEDACEPFKLGRVFEVADAFGVDLKMLVSQAQIDVLPRIPFQTIEVIQPSEADMWYKLLLTAEVAYKALGA